MGAWGHEPFENDAALDWAAWAADDAATAVDAALHAVAHLDYVEADEGSNAVAAATLVAAASDGDLQGLPEEVREAVRGWKPDLSILQLALDALQIVMGPKSELASLWGEGGGTTSWRTTLAQLLERLQRARRLAEAPRP